MTISTLEACSACTACDLASTRNTIVISRGNPKANLMPVSYTHLTLPTKVYV